MRRTIAALAFAAVAAGANAVIITQWDFEGDVLTPNIGSGTVGLVGGTTSTFATGWDRAAMSTGGRALNTSTYPAQGTGSGTAGIQFNVSTVGFLNIVVDWDHRNSNTSSKWVQFQYSTDGTTFSSAGLANGGLFSALGGDTWHPVRTVDLSSIAGVADNPNFAFRVVAVFDPALGEYVAANPNSNYASTGTQRFDNVTITGDVVPEPATLAAIVAGLGVLAARRRRK
ncbi:MAG: PEP-CTERM sorting domain-containing protein [Fimbriimonadales bacterium]|nr:PEP-CTERM sorting domain-containing protein [Fimbriimonadales bacterium]